MEDIKDKVEKELKRKRGPRRVTEEQPTETKTKFTREFSDGSVWTYDLKKNPNGPIQTTNKI